MKKKSILRNIIITLLALVAAGVISFIFQRLEVQEHITTIFVFSVFIVSLFTDGYFYGIFSSVVGTVAINFVFTYPFLKFDFITPVNVISAIIMLAIAVITGMLTTKIKTYEEAKAESEREKTRANLLRAVSHDLRTPLTSIYSASSLLRDEKETLTEEQKETMLSKMCIRDSAQDCTQSGRPLPHRYTSRVPKQGDQCAHLRQMCIRDRYSAGSIRRSQRRHPRAVALVAPP